MKDNRLKSKLKRNEPVFGMISPIPDPTIIEMIGLVGFDFYMLDGEHGAVTPAEAANAVRTCEAAGITPLARVPSLAHELILQALDMGMRGMMLPNMNTVDDLKRLVAWAKYPPVGERGLGVVRAADYFLGSMTQADYVRAANEQTLVFAQIENIAAVKNLGAMVQVEGVDGFIVGPRDLSMSMGFTDGPNHPEVSAVVDDIFKTLRGAGKFIGTTAATGEQAKRLVDQGVQVILHSVNNLLQSGATAFFKQVRG